MYYHYSDCYVYFGGGAVVDDCGVCGGDNSANTGICDCNGVPNGGAEYDVCGVCNGQSDTNTTCNCHLPCLTWDCEGVCGGGSQVDD